MLQHDIAFELGWEHARHSVCPPPSCATPDHPVHLGYEAGRQAFGARARPATPMAREWLNLRFQAWLRGRCFETLSVTPLYLQQIRVTHCPVTRQPLSPLRDDAPPRATDAVFTRLCDDAGYAAGHLAMTSRLADAAKAGLDLGEALEVARTLKGSATCVDGLNAAQWMRLAVLMSFVTPLSHDEAAGWPLCTMAPNRLHLLNPIQGLQAVITRLLAPHAQRDLRWSALVQILQDAPGQAHLPALIQHLLAARETVDQAESDIHRRQALEDLWNDEPLLQAWTRWARSFDAATTETLLERIIAFGLTGAHVLQHSPEQSTDGWALESRGFLALPAPAQVHILPMRHPVTPGARRQAA